MFGSGKDDNENPAVVGAKEKILRAKLLKRGMTLDEINSRREGMKPDLAVPTVIVYGMSVILALLLTQGTLSKGGLPFHLPWESVDRLLLGEHLPHVYDGDGVNQLIVVFIRGTAIFLLAGVIPFCTRLWLRFLDKTHANLYIAFWGMTVGLPFVYLLIRDFIWQMVSDVFGLFLK